MRLARVAMQEARGDRLEEILRSRVGMTCGALLSTVGSALPTAGERRIAAVEFVNGPRSRHRIYVRSSTAVPVEIEGVAMAFGSFSAGPTASGLTTRFAEGRVKAFQAVGFDACKAAAVSGDRDYRTPTGSFASKIECTRKPFTMNRPLTLGWKISYSLPSAATTSTSR